MTIFERAFLLLVEKEGYYDSAAKAAKYNDKGGETFIGIARKSFPFWEGWVDIDSCKADGKNPALLAQDDVMLGKVRSFYKENFWDPMQLDSVSEISLGIALELFDTGVNMWHASAIRFMQRTLNVLNENRKWPNIGVDGVMGKGGETFKALTAALSQPNGYGAKYEKAILTALNSLQVARYIDIGEKDPTQEGFELGWILHRGEDPWGAVRAFQASFIANP